MLMLFEWYFWQKLYTYGIDDQLLSQMMVMMMTTMTMMTKARTKKTIKMTIAEIQIGLDLPVYLMIDKSGEALYLECCLFLCV